jgi:hypothetical protein
MNFTKLINYSSIIIINYKNCYPYRKFSELGNQKV